ncbi:ribosome biogenesis protein Nop53/GLTSCR2 [Microdochium bolleyi]|uniref:Ribosome biogenesis protein NOP53 n=1 Tax=Microdochium bolleyi TaxID=196109 RepID=A0A136JDL0_9PEZI|nr:ribosome biogenesis protein Nop53/GLTSCR2 [Microdochium bolleyi]
MPVIKPAAGPTAGPGSFKQPSRKGKKAWRKNVDVTEVEEGLDELNEEIIKGGVVAERPADELFTLDVVGDAAITKKHPKKSSKLLKADEIIAARSAVPAVSLRKRASDKTTDGILPVKRQRTEYVTQKELSRLRKVADGHHESVIEISEDTFDPWTVAAPVKQKSAVIHDMRDDQKKAPKTITQKPLTLAASGKEIPAVAKPSGGYSYNPKFEDYEARYKAEADKAVEAEKKRLAEEEAERLRKEAVARSAAEAEAAEARAELSEWDEDSEWEGVQSGGEELQTSKKRPERKTPVQRNRVKRRKAEEGRLKHEAKERAKKAQAERIKEIAAQIAEQDSSLVLAENGEDSDNSMEGTDDVLRRKQLGKYRLPEKDLELVLPDELQDTLRLLKPEGNLLKDRYRSMMVRGRVEARRRRPFRKQARTTLTEKWSYKDFSI